MSSKVEKIENNVASLEIKVSPEDFGKAMQRAYKKNVKRFNIPGFRKGKAPMKVIELHYGEGVFYEDAFDFVFPDAYKAAIEENKLEPVAQPDIDIETISKKEGLVIKAEVAIKPEITLGEYKGIEVQKREVNVTEEDVQKELEKMQDQNARLITVEDRPVKEGDITIIDFKGYVNGETFEGGEGTNYSLEIGSGQFIPGFEEQLIGAEKGKDIKVEVTFPEEYHVKELAGENAIFEVKINEIKEKEVPALDDEFAKDVSEFDTLEELKQDIKKNLEEKQEHQIKHEMEEAIIEKIVENAQMVIPDAMIEEEVQRTLNQFDYQLRNQGITLEDYFKYTNIDEKEFKEGLKDDAKKKIETELTLEKIIEVEKIEATEKEIEKELENMAKQYNQEVDKLKETLGDSQMEYIEDIIKRRKCIAFLVENSKTI
ncbi:trigger factor [Garciella nitratireducens]|uniref:Trigger factor n=1 Tax=Garciella nitratireducens DSM 15102 TaxID=1121911 RepID=A0A1T4PHK5_9FIRM|nr:trigger factor [Garciella nitratireducens]RBP37612.1 trigger factor [Garciella nitratireducens]SJZ91015.1 trigger factor [Garciella nitratireducens DSM 15102]